MPKSEKKQVVIVARAPNSNWARVVQGALADRTGDTAILENARQALYYGQGSSGEFGLAVKGPSSDSRISPVVPRAEILGVGLILDCTEAALTAWRDAPVYVGR